MALTGITVIPYGRLAGPLVEIARIYMKLSQFQQRISAYASPDRFLEVARQRGATRTRRRQSLGHRVDVMA